MAGRGGGVVGWREMRKGLLRQKCFSIVFPAGAGAFAVNWWLKRGCSDICEPQRGTQAQVIVVLFLSTLLHRA